MVVSVRAPFPNLNLSHYGPPKAPKWDFSWEGACSVPSPSLSALSLLHCSSPLLRRGVCYRPQEDRPNLNFNPNPNWGQYSRRFVDERGCEVRGCVLGRKGEAPNLIQGFKLVPREGLQIVVEEGIQIR